MIKLSSLLGFLWVEIGRSKYRASHASVRWPMHGSFSVRRDSVALSA